MFTALLPSRDAIATGFNISARYTRLPTRRPRRTEYTRAGNSTESASAAAPQRDLDADTSFVSSDLKIYSRLDQCCCCCCCCCCRHRHHRLYGCCCCFCQRLSVRLARKPRNGDHFFTLTKNKRNEPSRRVVHQVRTHGQSVQSLLRECASTATNQISRTTTKIFFSR